VRPVAVAWTQPRTEHERTDRIEEGERAWQQPSGRVLRQEGTRISDNGRLQGLGERVVETSGTARNCAYGWRLRLKLGRARRGRR